MIGKRLLHAAADPHTKRSCSRDPLASINMLHIVRHFQYKQQQQQQQKRRCCIVAAWIIYQTWSSSSNSKKFPPLVQDTARSMEGDDARTTNKTTPR
ncbi:unnamed protein product [Absidia cylindrospora]